MNWDRNSAEQPSFYTIELIFIDICWCFSLKWSITISTLVMKAALDWSDSSLPMVTDHFILNITEIATHGVYIEPSCDQIKHPGFQFIACFYNFR